MYDCTEMGLKYEDLVSLLRVVHIGSNIWQFPENAIGRAHCKLISEIDIKEGRSIVTTLFANPNRNVDNN